MFAMEFSLGLFLIAQELSLAARALPAEWEGFCEAVFAIPRAMLLAAWAIPVIPLRRRCV